MSCTLPNAQQSSYRRVVHASSAAALVLLAALACSSKDGNTITGPPISFDSQRCGAGDTVRLAVAGYTRVDCSNGGVTIVLDGNSAHYLVVPEFVTDQAPNTRVSYRIVASAAGSPSSSLGSPGNSVSMAQGVLPVISPNRAQVAADRALLARGRALVASGAFANQAARAVVQGEASAATVPTVGSARNFHVRSSLTGNGTWTTVTATLAYAGTNVLIYVDNAAPANGFTAQQLQDFGKYFDQTLYDLDLTAFGAPSDIDQNGHVIMLMSPVVNADTPASTCNTQGYVAGFFDQIDFVTSNSNSNQGEIFYSIVPDPTGTVSCSHSVTELGNSTPGTFLHELQHLINFSQHVVVSGGNDGASWLDEGMSIVAEELGSLYFEAKCPPPACRTNPSQIFPDSAQGFVANFLFDSYVYALRPDTASLTLHTDDQGGFSWRGGDWLLTRWLGDHSTPGFYQRLERGPAGGIADIEQAAGASFNQLFAQFGLTLYTDSLPGLPRNAVPAELRFVTRNVKQLWGRLFTISGPSTQIPRPDPIVPAAIGTSATSATLVPGTPTYYRLDTPAGTPAVTILFAPATGNSFSANLKPQVAIFRLPPGQ